MTDISQQIQLAIDQVRSGNKAEARRILSQVVQKDPKNARAWYLLGQLVDKPDQVEYCLNKVLDLDPMNQQAAERLQQIRMSSTPQAQVSQGSHSAIHPEQTSKDARPPRKTQWWVYLLLIGSYAS